MELKYFSSETAKIIKSMSSFHLYHYYRLELLELKDLAIDYQSKKKNHLERRIYKHIACCVSFDYIYRVIKFKNRKINANTLISEIDYLLSLNKGFNQIKKEFNL